jgi:hypothetical protein
MAFWLLSWMPCDQLLEVSKCPPIEWIECVECMELVAEPRLPGGRAATELCRWKGNSDRECGGDKGGRLSTDARAAWLENMARLASSMDGRPKDK